MDGLSALLTAVAGLGSAFILGKVKQHTSAFDTKVGQWLKPAQPAIVVGLSVAAPYIAAHLPGVTIPDPATLINAPVSGIIGVVAAEYAKKLQGNK